LNSHAATAARLGEPSASDAQGNDASVEDLLFR
jgi:hypothetical protein